MKLLIIEDDHDTAQTLRDNLSYTFLVDIASTGREGEAMALTNAYDIILLDVMLPEIDGLSVCSTIRAQNSRVPILILTGKNEVRDTVHALAAGADDYLTKPYSLAELRARIQALLRRALYPQTPNPIRIRNLSLFSHERRVFYDDMPIFLRRKEFDLLEYLMRHAGTAVTRRVLLSHVWPTDTTKTSNTVDVHIKHLRDKIDRPFDAHFITTISGVGYRFEV